MSPELTESCPPVILVVKVLMAGSTKTYLNGNDSVIPQASLYKARLVYSVADPDREPAEFIIHKAADAPIAPDTHVGPGTILELRASAMKAAQSLQQADLQSNTQLRERSGSVSSEDRVVSFLYELMRDHLPAGKVEEIVSNSLVTPVHLSNGYLGAYAIDLATRLKTKE